jgi:hypothetical protein
MSGPRGQLEYCSDRNVLEAAIRHEIINYISQYVQDLVTRLRLGLYLALVRPLEGRSTSRVSDV